MPSGLTLVTDLLLGKFVDLFVFEVVGFELRACPCQAAAQPPGPCLQPFLLVGRAKHTAI
jgi:hypothetical protein